MTESFPPEPVVRQSVRAEAGFAYGAVGADIHVFGDGTPVYLLERWAECGQPDTGWLREVPSRTLNSRFAVVEFVGRDQEMADLRSWRADPRMRSARWMYGPGGVGKSRLAAEFAAESAAAGWLVVVATHGPGTVLPPPGSQDLRLDGAAGVLLVVDYADRWPFQHLTWLLSNALLHQLGLSTRILLLARTTDAWPAIRGSLANLQFSVSSSHLAPLPDGGGQRTEMFAAARAGFGACYGLSDVAAIESPVALDTEDMGLTLVVHMAALVAVDASVRGRPPPQNMADLTVYLLDREHAHWAHRHAADPERLSPRTMDRIVFTAVLSGPVTRPAGAALVDTLRLATPSDLVLDDHRSCYPAAAAGGVLEPLYPDRLAEDFLSLTLPGHDTDYPAKAWAATTTEQVVRFGGTAVLARCVVFLAAATERWPHVGETCLFPLLRDRPQMAVEAGSAALTAIAKLPGVGTEVLAAIEPHLPVGQHMTLDVGTAELLTELTRRRMAATTQPLERAELSNALVPRLHQAGRFAEAAQAAREAVASYRELVGPDRPAHRRALATALINLSACTNRIGGAGSWEASAEAVSILRGLPDATAVELAAALAAQSRAAFDDDRPSAIATLSEAVEVLRAAPVQDQAVQTMLAGTLTNLSAMQEGAMSRSAARAIAAESVVLYRRLAEKDPQSYRPELAGALINLAGHTTGHRFSGGLRRGIAQDLLRESIALFRELDRANPDFYREPLAMALGNLSVVLSGRKNRTEAVAVAAETVKLGRELAGRNPVRYLRVLAGALDTFGSRLAMTGRREEALGALTESAEIFLRLFRTEPASYAGRLSSVHRSFGRYLSVLTAYERGNPRHLRDMISSTTFRSAMADARRTQARIAAALAGETADGGAAPPATAVEAHAPAPAEPPVDDPVAAAEQRLAETPAGHPQQARRLSTLSTRLLSRYEREEADSDLERALRLGREAVALAADQPEERAKYQHNLAMVLRVRAGPGDLDEALDLVRASLATGPPAERRIWSVHLLAGVLQDVFESTRDPGDLEEAISTAREVAELSTADTDSPFRPAVLADLGTLLAARFELTGDRESLREALKLARDALTAVPPDDPDYQTYVTDMDRVAALWTGNPRTDTVTFFADSLFARIGAYLQPPNDDAPLLAAQARIEAEIVRREGARRPGADPGLFETLAMFHALRFRLTDGYGRAEEIAHAAAALARLDERGEPVGDIVRTTVDEGLEVMANYAAAVADHSPDEAAALFGPLAEHLPAEHRQRPIVLSEYWDVIYSRYERTRRAADLDHAVELAREAVALTPAEDPNRAARCSKLTTSLRSKFLQTEDSRYLTEAVDAARESLAAADREHPSYAYRLRSLCRVLADRFEVTRNVPDIEEALHVGRQALQVWQGGNPAKAELQAVLGRALFLHHGWRPDPAVLDEAVELMTLAASGMPAGHPHLRTTLTNLARYRYARAERTGVRADLEGAAEAARQALDMTSPEDPDRAVYAAMLRKLNHARLTSFADGGSES